ncbi:MAG TPA: SET domain-containing protein-lysine N-methyltransferase [Patescibacteria group bacterium]|nr:SET domain-containing protein-lysine N-methyltransferase [Patescibacteria group bacterium]
MKKTITSDKIYISKSKIPNAGRGVFAKRDIKKNETIEECPVIDILKHEMPSLEGSSLIAYIYFLGKKKDQAKLVLGFGSIYNHAYKPNAKYKLRQKDSIVEFICTKNIKKDSEITVSYNPKNLKNKLPLWFEVI